MNVKLASVNTSVVPTKAKVAVPVLFVTQESAVDLRSFGVGYWSQTMGGSLSQLKLLSRSTVNSYLLTYSMEQSPS